MNTQSDGWSREDDKQPFINHKKIKSNFNQRSLGRYSRRLIVKQTESGDWHIRSLAGRDDCRNYFFQIQLKLKQNKLRNVRKFSQKTVKFTAERHPNTETSATQCCHCNFQQFSYFFSIFLESLKQFQFSCEASRAKRSEIYFSRKEKELINSEVELDCESSSMTT